MQAVDIYRTAADELGTIVTRKEKEILRVGFGAWLVWEAQKKARSPWDIEESSVQGQKQRGKWVTDTK